jgi:hypothetical protein
MSQSGIIEKSEQKRQTILGEYDKTFFEMKIEAVRDIREIGQTLRQVIILLDTKINAIPQIQRDISDIKDALEIISLSLKNKGFLEENIATTEFLRR